MSIFGQKIALLFGNKLPEYPSLHEAEIALLSSRDAKLDRIQELSLDLADFNPDYLPESLKSIEKAYYNLHESNSFDSIGSTTGEFEECMAIYFGEVFVRNIPNSKWIVEEYAFKKGKYEIGVQKGLCKLMLFRFTDHYKTTKNKKRESIFRRFKQNCT